MPRRSRPASRKPPQHPMSILPQEKSVRVATNARPGSSRKRADQEDLSDSETSGSHSGTEDYSGEASEDSGSGSDSEQGDFEADAEPDAPRVAQWMDEEDLDEASNGDSESESSEDEEEADDDRLEADLKALPFGALRKAQKALAKTQAHNESGEEESYDESEPDEEPVPSQLDKGQEREEPREKKEVPKRKHKHAPMEMSSKRPVPRTRFVAPEKAVPRDPRFLPITGEFDRKRFHTQYSFLSEMHEEEMKTLKENLKRARKLLVNSPRDLREEREAEVQRLERAVKRAESMVNRDRQEKVQLEALSRVSKEEREKRKEGKKAWYMKNADKKALLLRAKYDALAASGGRGAVRKAIEKKQKKVSQKEKKKRPFVAGPPPRMGGDSSTSRKRPRSGDGGSRKRPRTS
ncbi:DUF947-domain-containing protein [Trametes cingulata]|nr:DUF947-domain-containing protein [Trametes cingulata]